jgi:NAD(P)-dependent dehydrogenase (short-subunit alcohol dehydrogenase family)
MAEAFDINDATREVAGGVEGLAEALLDVFVLASERAASGLGADLTTALLEGGDVFVGNVVEEHLHDTCMEGRRHAEVHRELHGGAEAWGLGEAPFGEEALEDARLDALSADVLIGHKSDAAAVALVKHVETDL